MGIVIMTFINLCILRIS